MTTETYVSTKFRKDPMFLVPVIAAIATFFFLAGGTLRIWTFQANLYDALKGAVETTQQEINDQSSDILLRMDEVKADVDEVKADVLDTAEASKNEITGIKAQAIMDIGDQKIESIHTITKTEKAKVEELTTYVDKEYGPDFIADQIARQVEIQIKEIIHEKEPNIDEMVQMLDLTTQGLLSDAGALNNEVHRILQDVNNLESGIALLDTKTTETKNTIGDLRRDVFLAERVISASNMVDPVIWELASYVVNRSTLWLLLVSFSSFLAIFLSMIAMYVSVTEKQRKP